MAKIKPVLSHSINLYADSWKDYEFFNNYSNQKTPDKSLCFRKEIEKFSFRSREFSGKTVESTVTQKNRSQKLSDLFIDWNPFTHWLRNHMTFWHQL